MNNTKEGFLFLEMASLNMTLPWFKRTFVWTRIHEILKMVFSHFTKSVKARRKPIVPFVKDMFLDSRGLYQIQLASGLTKNMNTYLKKDFHPIIRHWYSFYLYLVNLVPLAEKVQHQLCSFSRKFCFVDLLDF